MNQKWWIAIIGVVGIGLAFLLFPRPNTGEDIAEPTQNLEPLKEGEKIARRTPGKARPPVDPSHISTDPSEKPGMKEIIEKRNRPEVIYATKLVTPFSSMRYTLSREGSEDAKALADEVAATMGELRTIRLDPDAMTWDQLQEKTDAMMAKIAASPFASDQSITKALERYKQFVSEYHAAKSGQPVPGGEAAPAEPAAPGAAPEGEEGATP